MHNAATGINEDTLDILTLLTMGPMAPVTNTHSIYASLRRDHPVFEITNRPGAMDMNGNRSFLITRYVDVLGVLKDDKQFSSDINQRTMGIVMGPTVIGMDGKEHLKQRTLITPSMTPRVLKGDNFH